MKPRQPAIRLLTAMLLLGLSMTAPASTFYTISDSLSGSVKAISDGTSGTSGSFSSDKIVLAARDDGGGALQVLDEAVQGAA